MLDQRQMYGAARKMRTVQEPKQARKEASEDVRRINQNRGITEEPAGTEIQD